MKYSEISGIQQRDKIKKITRELLLGGSPFFSSLLMHLEPKEWQEPHVMATDGTNLFYNLELMKDYTDKELVFIIAHESMHCFPSKTPILTNKGLKQISQISIGDYVFSKEGNFTKVLASANRFHKGKVVRIKPAFGLEFEITEEHPILVYRLSKPIREQLGFPKSVAKYGLPVKPEFINAGDLNPNTDILVFPKPQKSQIDKKHLKILRRIRQSYDYKSIDLDEDTAYFLGFFVGDGHLSRPSKGLNNLNKWFGNNVSERLIILSLALDDDLNKLKQIIENKLYRSAITYRDKTKKVIRLSFSSVSVAKYLRSNFYDSEGNKAIPEWMLNMPENIKKAFISGLMASDGNVRSDNSNKFSNCSLNVIGITSLLLISLGELPHISIEKRKNENHHDLYSLIWKSEKQLNSKGITKDNQWLMPIRKYEKIDYEGFVYNIETESNTYVLPFLTVHNCGLRHPYRLGDRDPELANYAMDAAINPLLQDGKVGQMPKDAVYDVRFQNIDPNTGAKSWMPWEQIYAILDRERRQGKGSPKPKPGLGKVLPAPQPQPGQDPVGMTETDWAVAVEQARAMANKFGKMPGGADLAVKDARSKNSSALQILSNFVENCVPKDQSYAKLRRRFISEEIYLPAYRKENMPAIAVGFDTSGSIAGDPDMVKLFGEIITEIVRDYKPEKLDVYYCDTQVQNIQTFTPEDDIVFKPKGNGGTAFQPVFDAIKDKDYACVLYLTDLEGPTPKEPNIPTIWVTSEGTRLKGPFGETIRIGK